MSGILYLCATPIGNLGDISARCLEVFRSVDLIACEDTRRSIQLLNYFEIHKPLTSYHEHNKREKGEYIIGLLKKGQNVALVSDAGTPAISDPGEDLVRMCIENEIRVTSIPGCVAGVNALILSGLSTRRFAFEGFLSVNRRHRKEHLESVKNDTHTLIFYEAPHKLVYTLKDMYNILGDRKIALVRELTKLHEEVVRTTLSAAQTLYKDKSPKGEFVIIIEGAEKQEPENWWDGISVAEHIEKYISSGDDPKDAVKKTAKDRGIPKREAYNIYHRL
ncbi:MAG: 16S rRNA (cytidine(1402)-2'-O)-methyltransferase [Firmicutes bacterium]|nr:16S rRNA (cytidine(1402)-2'-O)-methyltransferase [Bacillota bacterium]